MVRQCRDVDGLSSVHLDHWADSERSDLTDPELLLGPEIIEVPMVSNANGHCGTTEVT